MQPRFITIGADPEVFLISEQTGRFVSSIGKIGGSKSDPRALERIGFYLQEDNVAVEFNIPPARELQEFVESIQWSVQRIEKEVKDQSCRVEIIPAAIFPNEELSHPRAQHAGCDPDYNAWKRVMNPRPRVADGNLRTGAGHVHVGISPKPKFSRECLVKAMDLNLGIGSVLLDDDALRKSLYGKAGAFRPASYGLEYRVLSNFWLRSKELIEWVYNQTHAAIVMAEEKGEKFFDEIGEEIQLCINTSDKDKSQALLKRFNIACI